MSFLNLFVFLVITTLRPLAFVYYHPISLLLIFFARHGIAALGGFAIAGRKGRPWATLATLTAKPLRWRFLTLLVLATAADICIYLISSSPSPSLPTVAPPSLAEDCDDRVIEAAALLVPALLINWCWRGSPASAEQEAPAPRTRRQLGVEVLCVLLALAMAGLFVSSNPSAPAPSLRAFTGWLGERTTLLWLLWTVGCVVAQQLTRDVVGTQRVPLADFVAWRHLISGVLLGTLLLASRSSHRPMELPPRDLLLALLHMGVVYLALVWFQYESLASFSMATVVRCNAFTALPQYLIYLSIEPGLWRQRSFWACAAVAACAIAPELLKGRREGEARLPFWTRLRRDPGAQISLRVLGACIFGIGIPVLLFMQNLRSGSPAEAPEHRLEHIYVTLVALPLAILAFMLSFLSRMVLKMAEADQLRSGNFGHIMKEPLAHAMGFFEFLDDPRLSREEIALAKKEIIQGLEIADYVARGMLDASIIDRRQLKTELQDLNIRAFLLECRSLLSLRPGNQAPLFDLDLDLDGVPEDLVLRCDPRRLKLVFYFLTDNSRKAWTRAHGSPLGVKVRWAGRLEEKKWLLLDISDNGPGVQGPIADSVTEAWISGDETGTGLGLYLTRRYIEAHGGTLKMSNIRPPETGLKVTLRLPLSHG